MDLEELRTKILKIHIDEMEQIEKENPTVTMKAKLLPERKKQSKITYYTFMIINSTSKIKIESLLEEKIYINNEIKGTVIDAYENKLVVSCGAFLKDVDYSLKRFINHNNVILKRKFEESNLIDISSIYNEKLDKTAVKYVDLEIPINIDFYGTKLNKSQKMAIYSAIQGENIKIVGPPGTGKTETIVEILYQLLKHNKSVLICGPSNISVDNILERYMKYHYPPWTGDFFRLGSSTKGLIEYNLENLIDEATKFIKKEKNEKNFERTKQKIILKYKKDFIKKSRLVFATLFSSLKVNQTYDVCIVDEACQASEIETFLALSKAQSFVLAGDPYQINSSHNLYENLNLPTFLLNTQYRMSANLIDFSNHHFYNSLIASIDKKEEQIDFLFREKSILFIDTAYFDYNEISVGMSKMNYKEAVIIKKTIDFLKLKRYDGNIGIITPYSAQTQCLNELIEIGKNITINTVDGFQGQERSIIIISLVRSNEAEEYGFLSDEKRFNVAITRCQKGLIIVGDSLNFRKSKFFTKYFKYLDENTTVIDPETFLSLLE
ncbi:hypothetical protein NUSPORA_01652 [Nucleospora cyclopteri]